MLATVVTNRCKVQSDSVRCSTIEAAHNRHCEYHGNSYDQKMSDLERGVLFAQAKARIAVMRR